MSSIFVSYRRQDAALQAGQIYDRLVKRFSSDGVFRDVNSTRPGADYVRVIGRKLDMCDVFLVVIGPRWLQKRDGVSRLDEPGDYVRIEILSALERNIRVIPVLVDGATMPTEEDLPAQLHPLARRQALPLDETAWKSGLNQLVRMISEHQRALDAPGDGDGDGDGEAWSRSAYHPFVGRSAPQPVSSAMEDRTGRGAKELRDAIELAGVDGLAARLGRAGRRSSWPVALLTTVVAGGVAAAAGGADTSGTMAAFLLALGLAATAWLAWRDLARRSVVMRYESEDANVRWPDTTPTGVGRRGPRAAVRRALRARAWRSGDAPSKRVAAAEAQSHQELIDAWRHLAGCAELRRIARSDRASSTRRKAGSGVELCDLVDVTAGLEGPDALVTNIEVPGVVACDHALHFLPDHVLVREGACFAELSYVALRADWQPMRFAEAQMPRDSERVGTTWERVNRNGDRNRRFKTNPEWPVMRYGRIELASQTGLRWILVSSQARAAERVVDALRSRAQPGSIASVRAVDEHGRVRNDSTAA